MQFTQGMLHDLKSVSRLSSRKNWEYAGKFEMGVNGRYKGITRHTLEKKNQVDVGTPDGSPTYHTHPCTLAGFHATLPSNSDFDLYIKGYPFLLTNLLCDRDGFYEIHLTDPHAMPLPHRVHDMMTTLRAEPFLCKRRVNDDGMEFYETTSDEWEAFVKDDLHARLHDLFSISATYRSFTDPKSSLRSS
jgi:hypothetical protein